LNIFSQISELSLPLIRVAKIVFTMSILVNSSACKDSTPPPAVPSFCSSGSEAAGSGLKLVQDQLDYRKDIYPILASTDEGKIYKCTVCHFPTYNRDDLDEKSASDLLRVIKDGSMPTRKEGDEKVSTVTADDISMIQKWYDQKFAAPPEKETTDIEDVTGSTDTKIGNEKSTTGGQDTKSNFNSGDATQGKTKC